MPIIIAIIPMICQKVICSLRAIIPIKIAKIILVDVKHGMTMLALAFVKANWVKIKVRVVTAKEIKVNAIIKVGAGMAVILFVAVCKAMKVPAVEPMINPAPA